MSTIDISQHAETKQVYQLPDKGYLLVTKQEGGYLLETKCSYYDMVAAFALLAEEILNQGIPDYGYKVRVHLRDILNNTINLNQAEPKDETEKAMENLKSFLERK